MDLERVRDIKFGFAETGRPAVDTRTHTLAGAIAIVAEAGFAVELLSHQDFGSATNHALILTVGLGLLIEAIDKITPIETTTYSPQDIEF